MFEPNANPTELRTSAGDFPLNEYRLRVAGRDWAILHTGAMLTEIDEQRFLSELKTRLPYGVMLWPAAIALAHEIMAREEEFRGRRVLELGAGTGLPGIVASSLGAQVTQTDRQEVALRLGRTNAERNHVTTVEHRLADWCDWKEAGRYDWIIGSDVIYSEAMHPHLRLVFESNLAPGGRVLLADPFRPVSLRFLDALEADGWRISVSKWTVGEEGEPRTIGVFELTAPTVSSPDVTDREAVREGIVRVDDVRGHAGDPGLPA